MAADLIDFLPPSKHPLPDLPGVTSYGYGFRGDRVDTKFRLLTRDDTIFQDLEERVRTRPNRQGYAAEQQDADPRLSTRRRRKYR